MSSGAQQLSQDFEQVKKLLETYPNIKIINTEGDPPEQYDIEYTIKGYKTDPDGSASPENKHEVRITIPFGYPHFPPTAKPITPIFHPDIDPDAIRIADFWQENNSLAELIIHIGQMICGNHYTTEEPFNQNAFEWFEERKSWLPFDILEPRDEDEGEAGSTSSESKEDQEIIPATDLDILKDDIDFPFDEEEVSGGDKADELSFEIEEEVTELQSDETDDEISLELGDEELSDSVDLMETEEGEDLFSLEQEDTSDDFSFDLADIEKEIADELGSSETDDPFDLDSEPVAESAEEEPTLEPDAEDLTGAIEESETIPEEANSEETGAEELDFGIEEGTLDLGDEPVAGLSSEETEAGELDFGIEEEDLDLGDEATVDLSSLEEEEVETPDILPEEPEDEEDKILSALSLDETVSSASQIDEQSLSIRSLIEQKQIFTAKKILADLPDADALPDKKEFELTIADAIAEAEELYKTADKHEQKGEFEKAGIILDLIANIATDFPGLEMSRNRIRESMMGSGQEKPGVTGEEKEEAADQVPGEKKPRKRKARAKMSFKIPVRIIVILFLVIVLGGIGAGGFYVYNSDNNKVQLAQESFQKSEQLISKKEFKEAKKQLESARAALQDIIFFNETEKESILQQISSVFKSSLFKEGLKGRILYGEIYVTLEAAKAIDKFNTQISYADKVLKAGKIDQAITAYEKSLPYAEKGGLEHEVKTISKKTNQLRMEMALNQAKQFEEQQDWFNASQEYKKALEFSRIVASQGEQKAVAKKFAAASYQHGLNEGLKWINDSQWQKSIDALQEVRQILEKSPGVVSENEKREIDKLLVQSRLYFYLGEARKSFENKAWENAIESYNNAITLLKKNSSLLGREGEENIKKIEKTILTTHVAEQQNQIERTNTINELKRTVDHYKAISTLIEKSSFKDDKALAEILDDARNKTIEINNQLMINEREQWLIDNFEKIFRDNYPSAKSSELQNPKVIFIKREDNLMIFNISCTEIKQGRKFRLEINYQNDLNNKTWSIYTGKIPLEKD